MKGKKEYEVNKAKIKLNALMGVTIIMGVTDLLRANVPDCQIPPYSANAIALLLLPPEILFQNRKLNRFICYIFLHAAFFTSFVFLGCHLNNFSWFSFEQLILVVI